MELDIGPAQHSPRASPRKAALEALERLLRAHVALSEHRDPEGNYGLLRPARDDEIDLIEAVFIHCGVPLPDTLRAVYRRTLGVGNPVSSLPVVAVPFLRAALPDEGFGPVIVGLDLFEEHLGLYRDEAALERPPFLHLGHASLIGLTVSRSGLWSLQDYQGRTELPQNEEFNLVFEAAFCSFVDQVLISWANDLAGDPVRRQDLELAQGARLATMPSAVQEAMELLVAPRPLGSKTWGDVYPLDNPDLLLSTRRSEGPIGATSPYIPVVGLPYGDNPSLASGIGPGTLLRLRPVEDNPFDPAAVEVWHDGETPVRVGFVAKAETHQVRDLPGGAVAWCLRVKGRSEQVLYATPEKLRPEEGASSGGEDVSQDWTLADGNHDLFSQRT